jgi:outer membrane protein assembly factor BamD (BamD/ComL family)
LSNAFGSQPKVGSSKWWKKHKSKRSFEVGKGYAVEGFEGYFDQNGQPIDGPAERLALVEEPDGLFPAIDPKVTYGKMKEAIGKGVNDDVARERFVEAETLFASGKYSKAVGGYRDAASRWPRSQIEEDSLFMIGESYFFGDRYLKASDAYNVLVEKYPNSQHMNSLVERMWSIAQYWEHEYFTGWKVPLSPNAYDKTRPTFDTVGHAIRTYENIRLNDPTGPRADDAIIATAGIHFRCKRYEDADYHYTLLRREYPRSEFQFEAHLLGLQAKLRKYQGPEYDGKSLKAAQRLALQLRRQFSGRLNAGEKERLRIVQAELNLQLVQRDVRMAQYYDDKKQYRSARQYYAQVIEKYPDTELAEQVRERLAEISDEPDEPKQRLAWLLEMVPQSRERKRVARIPELQDGRKLLASKPEPPKDSPTGVNSVPVTSTR